IKGVFVRRDELVAQIAADQTARSKADDIIPISFFTRNDINNNSSLESRNANFLWFQLFIEVLLRMYHTSSSRNELINFCKKNYAGNESEEEMIAEFEHKYKPDDAIRWYTRNTCLYRMLNKALRIHDFGTIFVLRSFITDIAKQLKKENERFVYATMGDKSSNSSSIIKVYRGQSISVDELNLMQLNINEFISMSCFLSTSKSRLTALKFASQSDVKPNTERILFEINIDIRLTKDFADVKHLSWFGGEDEVLIKLGTIFRIEKIIYDKKEQLWIAMVSLASEDDYGLKDLFSHMKHKIGEETNLNSLGKILIEMGQYDTAANYYEQYEKESQIAMADALFGLGFAAYRNKNYDKSLYSQTKALELREKLYSSHHPDVAQCHMHIGNVYLGKKVYNAALNYYKKALEIQEKTLDDNHPDFDKTYINIAAAHRLRGEYELALEYYDKGLQIQRIHLPSSHYDIGLTYHHIGHAYKGMHDYTKAMEYYEKATHIYRKTLPPSHKYIEQIENDKREIEQKLNLKSLGLVPSPPIIQ
ncbi:unnamed protein product, partial [Didymodactylos carnosus]